MLVSKVVFTRLRQFSHSLEAFCCCSSPSSPSSCLSSASPWPWSWLRTFHIGWMVLTNLVIQNIYGHGHAHIWKAFINFHLKIIHCIMLSICTLKFLSISQASSVWGPLCAPDVPSPCAACSPSPWAPPGTCSLPFPSGWPAHQSSSSMASVITNLTSCYYCQLSYEEEEFTHVALNQDLTEWVNLVPEVYFSLKEANLKRELSLILPQSLNIIIFSEETLSQNLENEIQDSLSRRRCKDPKWSQILIKTF